MDSKTQVLLGSTSGNIRACLRILSIVSTGGARAKPTVAQLNELARRLESADADLTKAVKHNGVSV